MHIKEALEEILNENQFPKADYQNAKGKIMGLLWRMHADSIEAQVPGVAEETMTLLQAIRSDGDSEENSLVLDAAQSEWMHAASESHTWENHGCAWVDFVFPTFFGAKVQRYVADEHGKLHPAGEA